IQRSMMLAIRRDCRRVRLAVSCPPSGDQRPRPHLRAPDVAAARALRGPAQNLARSLADRDASGMAILATARRARHASISERGDMIPEPLIHLVLTNPRIYRLAIAIPRSRGLDFGGHWRHPPGRRMPSQRPSCNPDLGGQRNVPKP